MPLSRPRSWSRLRMPVPLGSTHSLSSSLTWSDRRKTPEAPGLMGGALAKTRWPQRRRRKRTMAWRDTALISLPVTASRSAVVLEMTRGQGSKSTLLSGYSKIPTSLLFPRAQITLHLKSGVWKGTSPVAPLCQPPASLSSSTTRLGPPSSGRSTASCTRLLPSCSKRLSWWMMPVSQVCTKQTKVFLQLDWQESATRLVCEPTVKIGLWAQYSDTKPVYVWLKTGSFKSTIWWLQ